MSTQQDIYAAGSESHPPMLNKENYVPWSSHLLRYAKSRPNGKLIHNSIINGPYVRRMIPEPSDTNREIPVNKTFHMQTDDELTEKELKQIEADDQAIQTILLGPPEDIYVEKKAKLFNEWERFTYNERESIESYYHSFLKLMNDLKRNKHFLEKIASNLKFLNNLQPEWSRHKEVDELKAKRLAKTQDPLALMANSNNHYAFPAPHQDQSSFNQNYLQQPMPNPEDITNLTTAMNMALALMAKAFKLNYSSPTNNNQRISSNLRNRQIAQPGMNMGQDRQMQIVRGNGRNQFRQYAGQNVRNLTGVPGNANLNGNGNLVAARAKGNAAGQNGNQIRCYNCRGVGHYARNCTVRPKRQDAAYLRTQLLIAQKEEAGIQLQAEEYDLMVATTDLDEIKEVNANYILISNLQQASTSVTQSDKASVYDPDGSAEVHDYENCDDNEIFNMFTQEEQYTELLERIPDQHQVPQNDNYVIFEVTSLEQSGETVEQHPVNFEETHFKSLAKEADESLAKHKTLELEIEPLLRAVVSQDLISVVQKTYVVDTSDLQTELERTKERFENSYKDMQQKIERLQAQLGDLKGKSKDTSCVSDTHNPWSQKLEITSNSVSTPQEPKVVKNDKVIAPGMFRINPVKTSREEKHMPNTVRANNTKTRRPQPRSNTKNDRVPSASKSSRSKNKRAKAEEHHKNLLPSKNMKHMSSACNNIKLDSQDVISKVVCAMCKHCLISVNHDVCLRNYVNGKNSYGKKQKAKAYFIENQKKYQPKVTKPKKVGFLERLATPKPRKPRFLPRWSPTGRLFDQKGNIVDSSESERNLKLLINFVWKFMGTVRFENDHVAAIMGFGDLQWGNILITRVYFVEGLGHNLFSVGKSKRASHPPKPVLNSRQRLHLLHMDLCGPMRIASINGKRYVLVIVDDYSCYTWVHFLRSKDEAPEVIKTFLKRNIVLLQSHVIIIRTDNGTKFKNQALKEYFDSVGISHQMSSIQTPQQNGVVERRNQTLVEAARTMLIFSRAPLFLWAEAIATACFTQNRFIIHRRFNKTPYELINGKKPDISFLYVFEALCYPKNDHEDIGKLGAKGDIGFFIGYSADSCAYRIYNRRKKKIIETMNVSFDELSAMAFEQRSSKLRLQSMTSRQISSGLDLNYAPSIITTQQPTEGELDLLFEAMYDDYIGGQPSATARTVPPAQEPQVCQTSTVSTTIADTAPTPTNSSSHETNIPITSQDDDELDTNVLFYGNMFVNPFANPSTRIKSYLILTVSTMEPKNVKEAMTDPAWIDSMQEELLQFKRLDVWVLVPALDNISPLTLKWFFKNKHDEEQTVIQNKSRLVVRGCGIFINQSKYVFEILKKYGMESCDPIGTPMEIKDKLDLDQNGTPVDATKYHSMIGALMYLTSSRPDIVHATCLCARYQAKPTEKHLKEITIYCDSKSAIAISCNPVQHSRTKHIAVRYHFIKEHVEKGTIKLYFVKTDYQLADLFTRALPVDRFNYLVHRLESVDGVTTSFQRSQNSRPHARSIKDKYMMKAQVHVSKSFEISDVQALPQKKHY
nr:integrase, catalytic region, zinc finger, CCHC-type, peptidase aspartic, catalytic [Tanacetum cinerariifolium]